MCQCYHPPPARLLCLTQCQSWYKLDRRRYSCIKLADSSKWPKSPFQVTFQKKGILAVSGSDLWLELVTSSLRQNSSWTCVSTPFSLPSINFQALILTISWNRLKAIRTCFWTRQNFCSPLTGSDLIFAVSTYGMGKEGQKSSGLTRACYFLWLAKMATPRTGHQWPKCFINPFSNQNLCYYLSHNVHLIMVNGTQHCTVSEIWDLHHDPCKI